MEQKEIMKKIIEAVKNVVASMDVRGNSVIEDVVNRLATTSFEWIG